MKITIDKATKKKKNVKKPLQKACKIFTNACCFTGMEKNKILIIPLAARENKNYNTNTQTVLCVIRPSLVIVV